MHPLPTPAAPRLAILASEVTCPPRAAQPVRVLVPARCDWRATELGSFWLDAALAWRDRARNAAGLGEPILARVLLRDMRSAARTALMFARHYRRNCT